MGFRSATSRSLYRVDWYFEKADGINYKRAVKERLIMQKLKLLLFDTATAPRCHCLVDRQKCSTFYYCLQFKVVNVAMILRLPYSDME